MIKTDGLRGFDRIENITSWVDEYASEADLVVLEGYSYGSRGRAMYDIAELGGIVRWELHSLEKVVMEVPPSTLKLFATGKGNCGKDAMIANAIRKFGYQGESNDEADAYLLWQMALSVYGYGTVKLPRVQQEAAKKLTWPDLGKKS